MSDLYVTVKNVELRYRDTGGLGPALLLTHGIGSSLETWWQQEATLGKQFRVISWDLPGHGLSEFGQQPYNPDKFAAIAWALLDALNINRVTLGGNSLGAAISIRMMGMQPASVSSLVLLNSATLGRETPLPFKLMLMPVVGALLTKPTQRGVDMQLQAIFHPNYPISEETKAIVKRNVFRSGAQQAFVNTLKTQATVFGQRREEVARSRTVLQKATCPVVFAHGRQDSVLPVKHSELAHEQLPGSRLHIFEQCGHTPQIEKPDEVSALLMCHLAKPGSQSGSTENILQEA